MNKYEVIYIIDTAMEEGARKELIQKFADLIAANGGAVEKVDEWGKRRLAYAIDYKVEGYYVLMHFTAGPDVPKELQRNLQINENVIRSQVVKLLQKKSSVKPRPVRAPFAAPAAEAPVAAPVQETVAPVAEEAPAASAETVAAPAEA